MGTMIRIDLQIKAHRCSHLAVGNGFIALDIIEGKTGTFGAAGGSCGNVMEMLAWLGWSSLPSGRIGKDAAGDYIFEEYKQLGLNTENLIRDEKISTPIVIQRYRKTANGGRTHRFSLSCPDCGRWLPRFRSMTISQAATMLDSSIVPKVFYFDRVAPASLRLAKWAKNLGALVFFEPSSVGDEKLFFQAIDICHVMKYSHDCLGHVPDLAAARSPQLVIETKGEDGLSMRWRGRWSALPAFRASIFEDAAGSGDWCSAGFLHRVGTKGADGFSNLRKADIDSALKFGQALATLNCRFEGARGLMIHLDHRNVNKALRYLVEKRELVELKRKPEVQQNVLRDFCNFCNPERAVKKQRARQIS